MKGDLVHIFINISERTKSFKFYKLVLGFLGYKVEFEDDSQLGLNNGSTEIWLRSIKHNQSPKFDRNDVGLNHIAFKLAKKEEVDRFYNEVMVKNKIPTLYNSPRVFPDFTDDYYAIYFEDPDGIKLEVTAYTFEFEG